MPSASVRDSGTAGSPVAREARRRGLNVSEMIADSSGNGKIGTIQGLKPVPVVLGGTRGGPTVHTLRRDRWWRVPTTTVGFLGAFVVYFTWAAAQNKEGSPSPLSSSPAHSNDESVVVGTPATTSPPPTPSSVRSTSSSA